MNLCVQIQTIHVCEFLQSIFEKMIFFFHFCIDAEIWTEIHQNQVPKCTKLNFLKLGSMILLKVMFHLFNTSMKPQRVLCMPQVILNVGPIYLNKIKLLRVIFSNSLLQIRQETVQEIKTNTCIPAISNVLHKKRKGTITQVFAC